MFENPFTAAEIARRLHATRRDLAARNLDGAVFASPENVFYLTGLDHWGYFAPHLLLVPLEGKPVLVTRAMERVSIEKQVVSAEFRGHSDSETAADVMATVLKDRGFANRAVGLESWTSGMSHGLAASLQAQTACTWKDVSGLVDALRLIKSTEEQVLMRKAARVTEAAAGAAIAAIADGAVEHEVAAETLAAMTRAGGHPPGFGPFIRPGHRLGEEHATWGNDTLREGDLIFLELAGCVSRYHAPLGRIVRLGEPSDADAAMAQLSRKAFDAVLLALKPGNRARDVYASWQAIVDDAGYSHYQRHHCGYAVGIGLPPSWTGGNSVTGLRRDSDLAIKTGMSFHVLSWLMGTGHGDDFISNTVLVNERGAEVLTRI